MFVYSENEDEEGWGDLNSKYLMVKGSFHFILGFFCSSELPSRLSPVHELWVFSFYVQCFPSGVRRVDMDFLSVEQPLCD